MVSSSAALVEAEAAHGRAERERLVVDRGVELVGGEDGNVGGQLLGLDRDGLRGGVEDELFAEIGALSGRPGRGR
jgi:hypothetical protein